MNEEHKDINQEAWDLMDEEEINNEVQEEESETATEEEEIEEVIEEAEQESEKAVKEAELGVVPNQTMRPISASGREIQIDSVDELYKIAEEGIKYKKIYDDYKEDLGLIEALKENGISDDEINLLIDAKKGKKEAVSTLIKKLGIENPIDIEDTESEYTPQNHRVPVSDIELKKFIEEAQTANPEAYTKFTNFVAHELDEDSKREIFSDMSLLKELYENAKNGLMDMVAPIFMKKKLLNSEKRAIDIYAESVKEYIDKIKKEKEKQIEKEAEAKKKKSEKIKKASVGKSASTASTQNEDVNDIDFMSLSDEEFEKYYRQIVG